MKLRQKLIAKYFQKLQQGNGYGKVCGIGPVGFPNYRPICRQKGGFPLKTAAGKSIALPTTGLPLSPHCNPIPILFKDSLEVFPNSPGSPYPLLQQWFQGAIPNCAHPAKTCNRVNHLFATPTQGWLRCPQHSARRTLWVMPPTNRKAGFILRRSHLHP